MGNSLIALVFVVVANVLLFMAQIGMALSASAEGIPINSCYDITGGILADFISSGNNVNVSFSANTTNILPTQDTGGVLAGGTGIVFIDVFNNVLTWIKTVGAYAILIVTAPVAVLSCGGVPGYLVALLSVLWYAISVFVLVSFLWGRGD